MRGVNGRKIVLWYRSRCQTAKVSPVLFVLRSIFWLSIVFASISWPSDPIFSVMAKARAARGVQEILGQTIGMVQAGAEKACLRAPAACLEGAAHLSRMGAGQRPGGKDKTPPNSPVVDALAGANKYYNGGSP